MSKKNIIIVFIILVISVLAVILFWRAKSVNKKTANYSVTEIKGDCEKNQDGKNKEECYEQLFILYNSQPAKDCSIFPGASGQTCEKAKLVESAVTDKSEVGCQKLENENEKSSCEAQVLYSLAISNREVKYCEKIKQPEISADCRSVIDKIKSVKTEI